MSSKDLDWQNLLSQIREHCQKRIIDKSSNGISFCPKNKYLKVHSSDVNPSEYVLAIFKGKGLNDYDIIKSFGEMEENEKTAEEKQSPEWLYSPQAVVEMLDKGLLPEI